MDTLASEFLNSATLDVRTRVYLVEHCLGTVVMALEKLLKEVEKRNLMHADTLPSDFNPINHLASQLMRNNPRFANFSEASPYMGTLKLVEVRPFVVLAIMPRHNRLFD